MENSKIDFFFKFKIKEGYEERSQEVLKETLKITADKDPGVEIYEVFKDHNNVYCQHERYENEDALKLHCHNTMNQLGEWMQITENIQTVLVGKVSDEFLQNFAAYNIEVYLPHASLTR